MWLGAALPDLAGFGRFRLLGSTTDEAVTEGIALHHRSDDVFHSSGWFKSLQAELREPLAALGLTRGAVRAVAHVGPEMLLDRALVADHGASDQLDAAVGALEGRIEVLSGLVTSNHDGWRAHLGEIAASSPPAISSVHEVAARLHRVLLRRPRLAFDRSAVDGVAAALADVDDRVHTSAGELLDDLAGRLSA